MKKLLMTAAVALAMAAPVSPTLAHDESIERSNETFYRIMFIEFKPGKRARAHEIIEMYAAADKATGQGGVIEFHFDTGEWDHFVAFPMNHGPDEMSWAENPDGRKWREAFVKIAGGEDQAKALDAEFESLIQREDRHIGHIDRD